MKLITAGILNLSNLFPNGQNPFSIFNPPAGATSEQVLFSNARNIIILILAVLAVIWIGMAIFIGIKFVTSQGGEGYEAAGKSLRNLLIGVGAAFLFLLVIYLVSGVFFH